MVYLNTVRKEDPGVVSPAAVQLGDDTQRRYAACIQASKQARWDINLDVIKGRSFDPAHKFLPDGLSLAEEFPALWKREKRLPYPSSRSLPL